MKSNDTMFGRYEDDAGEEYYCPIDLRKNSNAAYGRQLENCVEVSTAGRYSGNLHVVDRFKTLTHGSMKVSRCPK